MLQGMQLQPTVSSSCAKTSTALFVLIIWLRLMSIFFVRSYFYQHLKQIYATASKNRLRDTMNYFLITSKRVDLSLTLYLP